MENEKIKCPVCGVGEIDAPANVPKDLLKKREVIAKALRDEGFSLREIMRIMNYKSQRSVQILLENSGK